MKIKFLGTGTSTGVPQIGCTCATCSSSDPHDARLRCSAVVELDNGKNILIDCGPDFRTQILNCGSLPLDALLITHSHYDHVGGIDDLRPYCKNGAHFPTYCTADVAADLHSRNPWSFAEHLYPGVPTFAIREITPGSPFEVAGATVTPLKVDHGHLPIVGFRIGPLGYITDCSHMPDCTVEALKGVELLVINALRIDPHPTHFSLSQSLEVIDSISPDRALLTHISHQMGPEHTVDLPSGVAFAFDGLEYKLSHTFPA